MLSQWQRHSRWRMYLNLLIFLVLICHCKMTPTDIPELSSTARRKSQDIGSLGDFTWQAWLLVDTESGLQAGLDSSTPLRKITPKSVFIAPVLPACPEGYRADNMSRCIRIVNIDTNAHFSFLLQRLNAIYANRDSTKTQKEPAGPLQLNIPLQAESKPQSTKTEIETETFSLNDPVVEPIEDEINLNRKKAKPHEPIESVYNIKNDTVSTSEDRPMLSPGNSSASDISKDDRRKSDTVVPVAEFIEETNDTNFSQVVDYKIPSASKTLLNTTNVRNLTVSDVEGNISTTEKQESTTEMSLALTTLLLSSVKFSDSNPDSDFNTETDKLLSTTPSDIDDFVTVQTLNLTSNLTTKEIVDVSVDSTSAPVTTLSEDSLIEIDEHLDNETSIKIGSEQESSRFNESQETDFFYDDDVEEEEYLYSTDTPDGEDSIDTENDEILKHGEAGITIPTRNIEHHDHHHHHHQQPQINQTQSQNKTLVIGDQVLIRFNNSMPTDKDEAGSSISSEVSIDGDLILETTILDVNTKKLQTTTIKSPNITNEKNNEDDTKKLLEIDKSHRSEPKVVLSSHDPVSTTLRGYKQTEQHMKLEIRTDDQRNEKHEAVSSTSESVTYNPPGVDPITETHVINEESNAKENVMKKNSNFSETVQSSVPLISRFNRTSIKFSPAEDYVRFPDYMRQAQSYVRFPSNEANSIHSQTYKQYPVDNAAYGSNNIKNNIPVRQKPVYYMAASAWRNQQQADHVPSMMDQRQKQSKPLLRFWSKMPLVRDPGIYPSDQSPDNKQINVQEQSRNRLSHTSTSRKRNFYSEISSEDTDKILIPELKLPIDG